MGLWRLCAVLAVLGLSVVLGACGDDDDDATAQGGTTSQNSSGDSLQAEVDAAYAGTFADPPTDSPEVQPDKNVWFIPIASVADFRSPGSVHDTAKQMGWKLTEFDGKFSPDTIVSGIRQAIADDADGIILYVIDCSNVKAALKDAERAGVMVVSGQGSDCNETEPGTPGLFDAATRFQGPGDEPLGYLEFLRDVWARNIAIAIANGTDGKGKIIDVFESDLHVTVEQDKAIRQHLKEVCPDCEIVETVEHTGAEIGPPLQQKIEQALARHPEANAMFNPYDAVTQITMSAVQSSGRQNDIYVLGGEGEIPVIDTLRSGKGTVDAASVTSVDWDLYAALDALNRLFNGEKEPEKGWPTGNGTILIDGDSDLPPKGERYQPDIDFRSAYQRAWGLE
jgi:ribose transport system substrate-binding protein